jgi:hypothetical protein
MHQSRLPRQTTKAVQQSAKTSATRPRSHRRTTTCRVSLASLLDPWPAADRSTWVHTTWARPTRRLGRGPRVLAETLATDRRTATATGRLRTRNRLGRRVRGRRERSRAFHVHWSSTGVWSLCFRCRHGERCLFLFRISFDVARFSTSYLFPSVAAQCRFDVERLEWSGAGWMAFALDQMWSRMDGLFRSACKGLRAWLINCPGWLLCVSCRCRKFVQSGQRMGKQRKSGISISLHVGSGLFFFSAPHPYSGGPGSINDRRFTFCFWVTRTSYFRAWGLL